MRVDTLTPHLDVTPGEAIVGRIRVHNDSQRDTSYRIRVVGVDGATAWRTVEGGVIPIGRDVEIDVPIAVPDTLGIGRHAVGIEVASDLPRERPVLAPVTLAVESVSRLELRADPSIMRGHRHAKFHLDLENHEPTAVDVSLVGGSPEVEVRFKPDRFHLPSGTRAFARGKVRGPRRWSGEPVQHFVTITARGRAATTSITARYVQRSLFPWRARTFVAALAVLAIFLGAIGAGAWWWYDRQGDTTATDEATTSPDADGRADGTTDPDADPDGDPDAGGGPGGPGGGDGGDAGGPGDGDAAAGSSLPTETDFGGTITLADGRDPTDVQVRLDRIALGATPSERAQPIGFRNGRAADDGGPVKLWPIRYGVLDAPGVASARQTESVRSAAAREGGVWQIAGVALRQNYEIVFSKPGYTTQSFVATPPEDGSNVTIDVELLPGDGSITGTVVGPSGGLGGVELVLTDGDITVSTTSSTDAGQVGFFSFEALGTPAVYTVTATLAGFATEVVQFELEPEAELVDQRIAMRTGVGTILGRISSGGAPYGGATVTATNGESTFTTTSLTIGDTGRYALPRLPIPGTYTITVSAEGHLDQSRRVRLTRASPNAPGVNFNLTSTTASVGGRVVDDRGRPVTGAGVTITRDDIGFSTATAGQEGTAGASDVAQDEGPFRAVRLVTAVAPAAGSFLIDELPPGEYVLAVDHYLHERFSTNIALAAGQRLNLGDIVIDRLPPGGPALGNLTLSAVDISQTLLTGATFTLTTPDPAGQFRRTLPAPGDPPRQFVQFMDLPVGTYKVRVSLEGYRDREEIVNVGEGDNQATITLLQLGKVTARVRDAITGDELDGYVLQMVQIFRDGTRGNAIGGNVITDPVNGTFWNANDDFPVGLWEVVVAQDPLAYRVPSQIIERTPTDSVTDLMRFEITRDSPATIELRLKAYAYPTLTVSAFEPAAGGTSVTPLADPDLAVDLTCDGSTTTVTGVQRRENGADVTGVYDVSRAEMQRLGKLETLGTCRVRVAGSAYVPVDVDLAGTVRVADDDRTYDRAVHVVMVEPPPVITGRVFWSDAGTDVDLPGTQIATTTSAIVGFTSPQTEGGAAPAAPSALTRPIAATWSGSTFTLSGQVFGAASYRLTAPDITPGIVVVDIPWTSPDNLLTADVSTAVTAVADDPATRTFDYAIELTDPLPGSLGGCVRILTRRVPPDLAGVGIAPFEPGGAAHAGGVQRPATFPVACVGGADFSVDPAAAGTWRVEFTPPAAGSYVLAPGATAAQQARIDPAQRVTTFGTTYIEQAAIDLTVTGDPGTAIDPLPLQPTYTLTGDLLSPGRSGPVPVGGSGAGTLALEALPVVLAAPLDQPAQYTLGLAAPGYDVSSATVSVTIEGQTTTSTGGAVITIPLLAGQRAAVTVGLTAFGTISGSVTAQQWPGVPDVIPATPPLVVEARQVRDPAGELLATPGPWTPATVDQAQDTFVFSGEEGYYEVRVAHPHYAAAFTSPAGAVLPGETEPSSPPVYLMGNGSNNPIGAFELSLEPATLDLDILQSRGGVPAPAAQVRLFRQSDGVPIVLDAASGEYGQAKPGATDAEAVRAVTDGRVVLPGLVPDTYRLEIRSIGEEGQDLAYPVIALITLPRGGTAAARVLAVDAVLPPLSHSLVVRVRVLNSEGNVSDEAISPNRLPVPASVTLDRAYDAESLDVTSGTDPAGTVPNDVAPTDLEPDAVLQRVATGDGTALESVVDFPFLPSGTHTITITPPTGYELIGSSPRDVTLAGNGGTTEEIVFLRVADVDVSLGIGPLGDDFPNRSIQLSYDGVPITGLTIGPDPVAPERFLLSGIAPKQGPYTLLITDDLHEHPLGDRSLQVPPDPDGDGQRFDVTMTRTAARISGNAFTSDSSASADQPLTSGRANLYDANDNLVQNQDVTDGDYEFDVTTAGNYRVELVRTDGGSIDTDYTTSSDVIVVTLGRVHDNDVVLLLKPTVSVTLTDPPADAQVLITQPIGSGIVGATSTTSTTKTWTFKVLPGVSYQFTASANRHYDREVLAAPQTFAHGSTTNLPLVGTLTLERRGVTVNVTKPNGDPLAAADVSLVVPGPSGNETFTRQATFASGQTVASAVFPVSAAQLLPLTGTATATVTATGYRTITGTANPTIRQATIDVTILPLVTANGTVQLGDDPVPDDTLVTARRTSDGQEHTVRTTGGTGSFTFPATFGAGEWTLSSGAVGYGAGTSSFTVTPSSASTVPSPIATTARNVNLSVAVTRPDGTAVTGWYLVRGGTTYTPTGTTVTFVEDATTSYAFVLREPNSFRGSLTFDLTTATLSNGSFTGNDSATLVAAPAIAGTVARASGSASLNGTTVTLTAAACPSSGPPAPSVGLVTPADTFTFPATTFDQSGLPFDRTATNTYCLAAAVGGGQAATGTRTITLTANPTTGVVTGANGTAAGALVVEMTAPLPPPPPP